MKLAAVNIYGTNCKSTNLILLHELEKKYRLSFLVNKRFFLFCFLCCKHVLCMQSGPSFGSPEKHFRCGRCCLQRVSLFGCVVSAYVVRLMRIFINLRVFFSIHMCLL